MTEPEPDDLKAIAAKLEVINLQLAQNKEARRKLLHGLFIVLCIAVVAVFIVIGAAGSPYLSWDYTDPETAVLGTALHAFEFAFVRIAPFVFVGALVGAVLTRRKG